MASQTQISIKDRNTAQQWLRSVEAINEEYHRAMEDASKCIEGIGEFMEGTAVDEFAKAGNKMLTCTERTFKQISEISNTVNSILNAVEKFTDNVVGGISGLSKLFG